MSKACMSLSSKYVFQRRSASSEVTQVGAAASDSCGNPWANTERTALAWSLRARRPSQVVNGGNAAAALRDFQSGLVHAVCSQVVELSVML